MTMIGGLTFATAGGRAGVGLAAEATGGIWMFWQQRPHVTIAPGFSVDVLNSVLQLGQRN